MNVKADCFCRFFCFWARWRDGADDKGCIISIENGAVNVDLTSAQVRVGDYLEVIVSGGYMTDPATGRRIRKR